MKDLQILDKGRSWTDSNQLLSDYLNDYFRTGADPVLNILEAGCGTQWNLDVQIDHRITGVDISREAMEIRKNTYNDIQDFIVGDLATVDVESEAYDLVYSSFVLEHLENAEAVLRRFFTWLRPGGLAVLIFPDRNSVFGFVTRVTPHWFHVFYYKRIVKFPNAGEAGQHPFPTYHNPVVSRKGMHNFCESQDLEIALEFATPFVAPSSNRLISAAISICVKLLAVCSLGRLSSRHQNLAMIIRKQ